MSNGYMLVRFATSPPQRIGKRDGKLDLTASDTEAALAEAINLRDIHLQSNGQFFVLFRDGEEAPLPLDA